MYTVFYVFNTFSIERLFFGLISIALKEKPHTFISYIYQYIILVKSLKMGFLGHKINVFCILEEIAKMPSKEVASIKNPINNVSPDIILNAYVMLFN